MKSLWKKLLPALLIAAGALLIFWLGARTAKQSGDGYSHRWHRMRSRSVIGMGYVRGQSMVTLKNKYAGFVSRVNFYDQAKLKKGDVILEYDDLPWRQAVTNKKNEIADLEKNLAQTEVSLARVTLDPVPDTFRNLQQRRMAVESKLKRLTHEDHVYQLLNKNHSISDLAQREKHQQFLAAQSEFDELVSNQKKIESGLPKLYVQEIQRTVDRLKVRIANGKQELQELLEEQKYYRIVAPKDGIGITHSDTIQGYNAAGTAAAEVHSGDRKLVYAYVEEELLHQISAGRHYRFRSTDYDCDDKGFAELEAYDATKEHNSRGDKCYHLVKFRVVRETVPLRINSIGQVEPL